MKFTRHEIAILVWLFFVGFTIPFMFSCQSVKPSDHYYSRTTPSSPVTQDEKDSVILYGGCSAVVLGYKDGKSYVATAGHCIDYAQRHKVKGVTVNGTLMLVEKTWCDAERDICFISVIGKLTPYKNLAKDKPPLQHGSDVIIGYVDDKMKITYGRAIPGQSGGGVFTPLGELWGVVSTTGQGVSIYPALERLNLLWMLGE